MEIPELKGKYTQEEKKQLLANLDIEGISPFLLFFYTMSHHNRYIIQRIQSNIGSANLRHGWQTSWKTLKFIKRAKSHVCLNSSGI